MKPDSRVVRKPSSQFEAHDDQSHVMMYQRKAKSDKKLGKFKKKLAKRKQVLRAEAAKTETEVEKETKRKKETESEVARDRRGGKKKIIIEEGAAAGGREGE